MRTLSTICAVALAAMTIACTQEGPRTGVETTGDTETISIAVSGMT